LKKLFLPALLLAALLLAGLSIRETALYMIGKVQLAQTKARAHGGDLNWAQDNLKRNDAGCPTAVFVAPHGELVQCQGVDPTPAPSSDDVAHSTQPGYPTIEEAAIEGLKAIALKPTANWYEWGGEIIKTTNGYVALPPNTSFAAQHVHIDDQPGNVVGSYHTHVCNARFAHHLFSPADLSEPIFFHRPIFMGDLCTGLVHQFKPGDKVDVTHLAEDDSAPWSTPGWIVGKFTTPHQAN
jgi:hypothetical protein